MTIASPVAAPVLLDLGSGPEPAPGHLGVDLGGDGVSVIHCDLWDGRAWPWEDDSVDGLRAWHVIEHIPHERVSIGLGEAKVYRPANSRSPATVPYRRTQDAFYWFFDEAFRVAKPGARFELAWPHPWHDWAHQDPTHQRSVTVATLQYLSREGRRLLRAAHLPVECDWQIVPGSVLMLGTDEELEPYADEVGRRTDGQPEACSGSLPANLLAAQRHVGSFHEIRATLVKPEARG